MKSRVLIAAVLLLLPRLSFAQAGYAQRGPEPLSALGSVRLDVSGMGTARVTVAGVYVGTVTFEVAGDTGEAPVAVDCATPADPGTAVNSTTSTGTWICPVAGLRVLQARMSAYTSGTASIYLAAAATGGGNSGGGGSGSNAAASSTGAAVPGSASYTGFNSGGNLVGVSSSAPLPITNAAMSATGGAVPSSAVYLGLNVGSNIVAPTGMSLGSQIALPVAIVDSSGAQITPNTQDPCEAATRTQVLINQTTSTQVLAGTSSVKIYVCSFHLISATAQNIAVVEGTGSVCATGIAGVAGGTTAATGWNLAANSGLSLGTGGKWVMQTATNADNFCILQSGAGQVSGSFTYVKQ